MCSGMSSWYVLDEKGLESSSRDSTVLAKMGMPLFVLGHFLGLSVVQDRRDLHSLRSSLI